MGNDRHRSVDGKTNLPLHNNESLQDKGLLEKSDAS